jgi:high affinity Mn2+ porin
MLGDGRLNYAPEWVADAYDSAGLGKLLHATVEAQYFAHPGFNRDRGPVMVLGARFHMEYPAGDLKN